MYHYSASMWMAFFYVYCVFGWVFESTVVTVKEKKPVNRGFMAGPWVPLYGCGAVLVLFVTLPVRGNVVLVYMVGLVAATALEYVTGVAMERMFGVRYWDYSTQAYNYKGQICLTSSLAWGVLTVLLVDVMHPPIERALMLMDQTWLDHITRMITIVFTLDFAFAFRTAMDMRDALIRVQQIRKELRLMHKRIEVYEAFFNDSVEKARKQALSNVSSHVKEERAKVRELGADIRQMSQKLAHMRGLEARDSASIRIRRMMERNPSARSMRYKDEWQYLKGNIDDDNNDTGSGSQS